MLVYFTLGGVDYAARIARDPVGALSVELQCLGCTHLSFALLEIGSESHTPSPSATHLALTLDEILALQRMLSTVLNHSTDPWRINIPMLAQHAFTEYRTPRHRLISSDSASLESK
ncbi:hypothetical protein B0H13DRAFT_2329496 [Mycena leptocephala]|nr:hypothetical protein B0H13DRAFT_2329496 [Mycena leptocephala]